MTRPNLWAPWRIDYLRDLTGPTPRPDDEGCFLCQAADEATSDEDRAARLVLVCDHRGVLMLNRYPYTNGHLLAAPREHIGNISDLTAAQRASLMELTDLGNRLLNEAINPQGVNIGMNIGRCAGAGVPGHVHMHLVPRWHGDVNFIDVVAGVRVIPEAIDVSYQTLRDALARMENA